MNAPETGIEQKKVMQLYAALGAALLLSVVPFILAALLSGGLFLGVLIAAYILRTGTEDGSLIENHTTYVIRTIWISGFIALLTMTAGSIYLFETVDNTPLDPCIHHFISMGEGAVMTLDPAALMNIFKGCFTNYMEINFRIFVIAAAISAGPVLIYFIVRFARGFSRASSGYRIANPQHWF